MSWGAVFAHLTHNKNANISVGGTTEMTVNGNGMKNEAVKLKDPR